ncbi:MAG: hypothetical protein Q9182_000982 [Xanthomendoza sp. 2 TL-2023]
MQYPRSMTDSNSSYVGTLHEINSENSTVALENVTSWGTEGRDPENEVPPSEIVYEYIVFRGSDVKDLRIEEAPKENRPPQPRQVPDDPAILGSARRQAAPETTQKPQEPQPPINQPQKDQAQQTLQHQQRQQQPPRFPQQSPFPPYYNPYGPPPNQRFGPQGFPPGQGWPGMPYGAPPPPGWFPPPGQGFPHQGYGHFPPPQLPIGSGHQQNQHPPNQQQTAPNVPATSQEQPPPLQQKSPDKPVATVRLPSSSTTPAPAEAAVNGPPPPTESKPNIAAALAPPAPVANNDANRVTTEKNTQAAQKNSRIVPAVPRASPAVKPAVPVNGALQGNKANIPKPPSQPQPADMKPTPPATKTIEDANRDARAAVAAAMAKLPPAPGSGQQQIKKTATTNNKKEDSQNSSVVDNLTNKVNEMRTNDNIRTSRQPGTGGYAAGHRGGRSNYRGNRPRNDSQTKKVEVPSTDYDFETANAKFNKQDLVKEAIASGSPLASPLDGATDIPPATLAATNGDGEPNVSILPASVGYNKTTSFFDNISSESKEREEGVAKKGGREFRNEEVRKNLETFGQGSVDGGRGGFRGRGRGRGFAGRGRGFANGNGRGRGGVRGTSGRAGVVAES